MIDKNVLRWKAEDEEKDFALYNLHVDGRKLISDYGMEFIRETSKILLVEGFCKKLPPEKLDERIREVICDAFLKASHGIAMEELKNLVEQRPEHCMNVVKEIMTGEGEK